jgi:hypothetical protein
LRFGVVAPVTGEVRTWRDQLRGLADSGYSTILSPTCWRGNPRRHRRWPLRDWPRSVGLMVPHTEPLGDRSRTDDEMLSARRRTAHPRAER